MKEYKNKLEKIKLEQEETKNELGQLKKEKNRLEKQLESKQQYLNHLKSKQDSKPAEDVQKDNKRISELKNNYQHKLSAAKSVKSRTDNRKKGISLCSKPMSKNNSLSKKQKESEMS